MPRNNQKSQLGFLKVGRNGILNFLKRDGKIAEVGLHGAVTATSCHPLNRYVWHLLSLQPTSDVSVRAKQHLGDVAAIEPTEK